MSKILELYKDILDSKQRFVDEIFEEEIYKSSVPKLTIVDLGAFEGEFSFYCYNFAKTIYAVEPDPRPFAVLERRVKEFELDKIKVFPIAIAGETKERILYASGEGGSHFVEGSKTNAEGKEVKVNAMSILDFFTKESIEHVDILKVDIEDAENEIFNKDDFAKVSSKIDVIIGEHLEGVRGDLIKLGFKPKEVEGRNLMFTKDE